LARPSKKTADEKMRVVLSVQHGEQTATNAEQRPLQAPATVDLLGPWAGTTTGGGEPPGSTCWPFLNPTGRGQLAPRRVARSAKL